MTLYSLPPILSLICFLGLAVLTVLRRPWTTVNLLFFFICLLGVFLYLDILIIFNIRSETIALFVSRLDHVFVIYTIPVYIHFFHAYLGIAGRKKLILMSYGYAFLLMWFSFTPFYIQKMNVHPFGFYGQGGRPYLLIGLGAAGAVLYSIWILVCSIRSEKSSIQKNKLKYVLTGFGTLGILNGLNVLPLLGFAIYPPGAFSFIPLVVFAIGLFKYDLLDMGIIINKSLLYSLITAFFTSMYALFLTVADHALQTTRFSTSVLFPLFFFFCVSVGFGPIQSFVQRRLDRFFGRKQQRLHEFINHISRCIVSSLNIDTIASHLTQGIGNNMQIERVSLFLRHRQKDGFIRISSWGVNDRELKTLTSAGLKALGASMKVGSRPVVKRRLLEKGDHAEIRQVILEMEKLRAEIVFPLRIESRCIGFLVLGEKQSGSLYLSGEIDLLFALSVQAALALENATSYMRLNALNKTLEDKVEKRTRALQEALEAKEKSQEQLVRSESLASIGQLVAGVAHELNNPLSAAISLIQSTHEDLVTIDALKKEKTVGDRLKKDVAFAANELNRAKKIVASLLCLSRQTYRRTEAVNLNQVIRDALKVLQNHIKQHRIHVEKKFESNLPTIQGNFANLGQVAINIIKNACQAVADNGTIQITTRYLRAKNQILFSCLDSGPGIPMMVRNDIFKPFFTTKEAGHGTGLGLYICHEIVQKHKGSITQKNVQSLGALFNVYLPVSNG